MVIYRLMIAGCSRLFPVRVMQRAIARQAVNELLTCPQRQWEESVKSSLVRPAAEGRGAARTLAFAGALATVLSSAARAQSPVLGVNFTNADRLSIAARDTALDQMRAAGVKAIRTPLAQQWGAGSYQPSVDVVKAAWARG